MPAGTKRPHTKEKKLTVASNKATQDFKDNRDKLNSAKKRATGLDLFAATETYVRAFKDSGKRKKMEAAKEALKKSPTGTKTKTVISAKKMPHEIKDPREISFKNGNYKVK